MSNVKRPFSALQEVPLGFSEPPSTTKKLKITSDHPLKLYARLSPTSTDQTDAVFVDFEESSITLNRTKDELNGKESGAHDKFQFNQVLNPQTTQTELMKTVSLPLLEDLVRLDKSGVIFLYGSKSCDKTHTLLGDANDPGLLPRCLKTLLDYRAKLRQGASEDVPLCAEGKLELFEERKKVSVMKPNVSNMEFKICFEAFEICNDDIYDLLRDGKAYGLQMKQKLQLKEKDSQRVFVKDLSNIEISTDQQAIEALSRFRNKLEEDDAIFSLSGKGSKSHYVFKITAKKSQKNGFNNSNAFKGNKSYTTASLCIVQLAGSDKPKKFGALDSLSKTDPSTANANKSLTILAKCLKDIKELREGQNTNGHSMTNTWTVSPVGKPPMYKDSKLTRFLFEYFYDDCNLRLIAHLNTNSLDLEDTSRALNYTSQLRGISYITTTINSQGPSVTKTSVKKILPFGENMSNSKNIVDKTNQENFKNLISAATLRIEALVKSTDSTNKRPVLGDCTNKIRTQMSDLFEEEPNLEFDEPAKFNQRLQSTFMPLADVPGQENLLDDVSFGDFMETEGQTNGPPSRLDSGLYSKMSTMQLLTLPTIEEENFPEALQEEVQTKPAEEVPAHTELKKVSPVQQDVAVKESPVKKGVQEDSFEPEAPISTLQSSIMTETLPAALIAPPQYAETQVEKTCSADVMETEEPSHLFESKIANPEEACLNVSSDILPEVPKENPVEEVAPVEAMEMEIPQPIAEDMPSQNMQSEPYLQEEVAPVLETVMIEEKPCENVVAPEIPCLPVETAPEVDASILIEEKPSEKMLVQEVAPVETQPDLVFMPSLQNVSISPIKPLRAPLVLEDVPSVSTSLMETEVHIEMIEDNAKTLPLRRESFDEPMKPRSKNILALSEKSASVKSTNSESSNGMKPALITPKRVVSKAIITEKGKENQFSMGQSRIRSETKIKTPAMTPKMENKAKPMQVKTSVKKDEDKIKESREKDLKIELLEGILQKLQEKICFRSINEKLQQVNENFKKSMKGLIKPNTNPSNMDLLAFSHNFWATMAANAENGKTPGKNQGNAGSILGDISVDNLVPMPPINVNYFVFNGAMEPEKLNSLENILKTHTNNSFNQNNIFILEDKTKDKVMVEETPVPFMGTTARKSRGRPRKSEIKIEPQEMKIEDHSVRYNTRFSTRQSEVKKKLEQRAKNIFKLEEASSVQILDSENEEAKIEIEIEVISDSEDVKMVVEKKKPKQEVKQAKQVQQEGDLPIASRTRGKARQRT